jgi:small subunit ribosomal protein S20
VIASKSSGEVSPPRGSCQSDLAAKTPCRLDLSFEIGYFYRSLAAKLGTPALCGCGAHAAGICSGVPFFPDPSCSRGFFVPNIQSAKKDLRKSRAAAVRNRAQRSALRTALKKAKAGGTADERLSAVSLLDRAARKGLIHRNAAARQKSKLAKRAAAAA